MSTIASLSVLLKADTSGLASGLKAAAGQVDSFAKSVGSKIAAIDLSGLTLGLVGAAAGIGAALGALTSSGMDRIDQLGDSAQQLGVTTKALSELRYAANLTGSSAEDLDAALGKLNQNLGDAALKANPTSEALQRLGLDAKDLSKLSPDEAFKKIVGGFGKIPGAAEKASLAMDIFGKGGVKILNTLGAGTEELDRLSKEAQRLGVSIDQVDQAKIGAAKDALDHAGAAVEGLGNQLAVTLAPYIEVAANAFADLFADLIEGGSVVDGFVDGFVQGLANIANFAGGFASGVLGAFAKVAGGIASLLEYLGKGGETARAVANGLQDAASSAGDLQAGDKILSFYDGVKKKAGEAAESVAKAAAENLKAGTSFDAVGKSVKDLTTKLKDQIATYGMSASEVELYKLAQQGATAEQLKEAKALADQLKALEDKKPGAAKEVGKKDGELKLAAALDAGGAEARSAILAATSGRGAAGIERSSQATAANTGKSVGLLQGIQNALEGWNDQVFSI